MKRGAFFSRYPYRRVASESVHLLKQAQHSLSSSPQMGTGASHNLSDEAIEALKTLPEHIQREIAAAAEAATPAVNISTPRAEPQPPQATEPQEEPAASATAATEEETAVEAEAFAKAAAEAKDMAAAQLAADPDRLRVAKPAAFYAAMKPLEPGGAAPFRFLKGSWIREQAKKIRKAKEDGDEAALKSLAIKFRQEMPEEAFMTVEEVERLSGTINDIFKRLAAAAVSYCWETREHPDPECNSFLALADALEKCYEEKGKDTSSITEDSPRTLQYFGITRVFFSTRRAASAPRSRIGSSRCAPHRLCCCCCAALTRFTSFATHMHAVWPRQPRSGLCARRHDHLPAPRLGAAHPPVLRTRALGRHTHLPRLTAGTHHSSGPPRLTADPPPSTA